MHEMQESVSGGIVGLIGGLPCWGDVVASAC
jgi:hypothetical protein